MNSQLEFFGQMLEDRMRVANDVKKEFHYVKDTGEWYWTDRDEADNVDAHTDAVRFCSFRECLYDATEPYFEGYEE